MYVTLILLENDNYLLNLWAVDYIIRDDKSIKHKNAILSIIF